MANDEIAVTLSQVGKKYLLGKPAAGSLRENLAGLFARSHADSNEFWALKNVSLEIRKGDVVGIIGKNGAGKSTLLKILSGITPPSEGSMEINGRISSLLEVGTGFHPELTGRENIFLNGTILGMSRKEVSARFDEIVAFSGTGHFIDTAVKHYSSGMYVRLAFAVAAHLETEILVVDEVLAVGDAEFQQKCLGKMDEIAGAGKTVLFVSHDMGAMSRLCKTGILLEDGEVAHHGDMQEAIQRYLQGRSNETEIRDVTGRKGNQQVQFTDFRISNQQGLENPVFFIGDDLHLNLSLTRNQRSIEVARIAVQIVDSTGRPFAFCMPQDSGMEETWLNDSTEFEVRFTDLRFYPGTYYFKLICACQNSVELYDEVEFGSFRVEIGGKLVSRSLHPSQGQYFLTPTWERL